MRICRLCLSTDEATEFQEVDAKLTADCLFVCGITLIQHESLGSSLVCSQCTSNLDSAATLKKVVLLAEVFFKKRVEEFESKQNPNSSSEADFENLIEYVEDTEEFIDDEGLLELEIESTPQEESQVTDENSVYSKDLQCDCGLVFASADQLQNHVRNKHDLVQISKLLPCDVCGRKFKNKEFLELHIKNIHSGQSPAKQKPVPPCSICGKVLSSQVALKNHENKHFIDSQPDLAKNFICDFCGQTFRLKSYIFNHMNNMHVRMRKYNCSYCERNFYKKFEMNDHIRQQHTLETPFRCEFEGCSKSFSRKKNYLIHKRIHTNVRPYSCNFDGCDRSFIHYIDKKRHMMKHTGQRPFPCTQAGCEKSFMRQSEMKSHLKSHCRL